MATIDTSWTKGCHPMLGTLKNLYAALVGDPDAWAYSKHLFVAPFSRPWSPKAILQVAKYRRVGST